MSRRCSTRAAQEQHKSRGHIACKPWTPVRFWAPSPIVTGVDLDREGLLHLRVHAQELLRLEVVVAPYSVPARWPLTRASTTSRATLHGKVTDPAGGNVTSTTPCLTSHRDHHACSGGSEGVSTDRDQRGQARARIASNSWTQLAATTTHRRASQKLRRSERRPPAPATHGPLLSRHADRQRCVSTSGSSRPVVEASAASARLPSQGRSTIRELVYCGNNGGLSN